MGNTLNIYFDPADVGENEHTELYANLNSNYGFEIIKSKRDVVFHNEHMAMQICDYGEIKISTYLTDFINKENPLTKEKIKISDVEEIIDQIIKTTNPYKLVDGAENTLDLSDWIK